MGCHDKHLVDAKAQYDVDKHVEGEAREAEPQETALSSQPDTYSCQDKYECLYNITKCPSIGYEYRTLYKYIFKQMVMMELKRLAKQVLVAGLPA